MNDLEAIKKKRRFLRKSVADTFKSIDETLSIPDNHARIQVLKDNIANKSSRSIFKKKRPRCVLY